VPTSRRDPVGKVRYAVVGLGHIAQVAVLPAFAHAARNSRLVALVSRDAEKRRLVAKKYRVDHTYSYDDYDACLEQVDAVYIALPNSMHAEYTIRAARAGVHVLCEKPMAVTVEECRKMIDACRKHRVRLMIAYRLHFEEINLAVIDLVRKGRIGTPKFFNSSFALTVTGGNIRTDKELGGGSLYDIGVYCINAARHVFRLEPKEVMAISVNSGSPKLREIDESTAALLRFDGEKVAAFVTSFNAADVACSASSARRPCSSSCLRARRGTRLRATIGGKTTRTLSASDQFVRTPTFQTAFSATAHRSHREKRGCKTSASCRRSTSRRRPARRSRFLIVPRSGRADGKRIVRPGIPKPKLVKVDNGSE
jgi:glucose-fructose oxidoreductase